VLVIRASCQKQTFLQWGLCLEADELLACVSDCLVKRLGDVMPINLLRTSTLRRGSFNGAGNAGWRLQEVLQQVDLLHAPDG